MGGRAPHLFTLRAHALWVADERGQLAGALPYVDTLHSSHAMVGGTRWRRGYLRMRAVHVHVRAPGPAHALFRIQRMPAWWQGVEPACDAQASAVHACPYINRGRHVPPPPLVHACMRLTWSLP